MLRPQLVTMMVLVFIGTDFFRAEDKFVRYQTTGRKEFKYRYYKVYKHFRISIEHFVYYVEYAFKAGSW